MEPGLQLTEIVKKESVSIYLDEYCLSDDYSLNRDVQIGTMFDMCPYFKAFKFNGETMGMCCASGKVKLPQLGTPTEPLNTLLTGNTSESNRFL